jgi:CheY-like chemotaxis protein
MGLLGRGNRMESAKAKRGNMSIKSLVWPFVFLVIAIVALIMSQNKSTVKEMELSPKGIKISFYLLQAEERGGPSGQPPTTPVNEKQILITASSSQTISLVGKKILWVDDNPDNNVSERRALEALGLSFALAESTEQALRYLDTTSVDAVISDFKRKDDSQGGYTLLERLKERNLRIPYIIYTGSASPELEAEAKKRGALGETNRPTRLFELVIEALQKKAQEKYFLK